MTATSAAEFEWDLAELLGGTRGVIDAAAPGVALVIVNAFAALSWAIVAALCAAAVIAVLRRLRGEPLRQAGFGLLGLAGAAGLAAITGNAKTYFLPGILLNAAYAAGALISIVARRPLLGFAAEIWDRGYSHWRHDRQLKRAATVGTAIWMLVFAARAGVQGYLYLHNKVHWLAPVKLGMGLPLWALAITGSLLLLKGHRTPAPES
jgi:hypothetical protein